MRALLWLSIVLSGSPPPETPLLLSPRAALSEARARLATASDPAERLRIAEIQLLAGDPAAARATLATIPPTGADPRRLRLELDVLVALGDPAPALPAIRALATQPGWGAHAAGARAALDNLILRHRIARFGGVLFAGAIGVLLLGGARELLRPRRETVLFAAAAAIAVLLAADLPLLARVLGLVYAAWLALVHAAVATERRTAPGPRGRALFASLVVLGAAGGALAVLAPIPLALLVASPS